MLRNVASQKWRVYAWDTTTGQAKTGDAAQISGYLTVDDGTPAATDDSAPTEVDATNEPGMYEFNLLQAETDGFKVSLACKSSTADIAVMATPPVADPVPQYASKLGIESDGDVTKTNLVATTTANTDMRGTDGALTDKTGFSLSVAGILAIWHQLVAAIVDSDTIGKLFKDAITITRMEELDPANLPADIELIKGNTDYSEGFVWFAPGTANSGTVPGTNGTLSNPASNLNDAVTISQAINATVSPGVKFKPGSQDGYTVTVPTVIPSQFSLDLNGAYLDAADDLTLGGVAVNLYSSRAGASLIFHVDRFVIPSTSYVTNIGLSGTAGFEIAHGVKLNHCLVNYTTPDCLVNIDIGVPASIYGCIFLTEGFEFDYTAAGISTATLLLDDCWGNLEVSNMSGSQVFAYRGWGKLTIAASCSGGTVQHTSHVKVTDLSGGAVTIDLVSEPNTTITRLNDTLEDDGGTYRFTANALEEGSSGATVDEIFDELQAGHTVPGSFGLYIDTTISGIGGSIGPGANTVVITADDSSDPIAQAQMWVSTDEAGSNVVAGTIYTNDFGKVSFLLTYGLVYYVWIKKSGFNPILAQSIVAAATYSISMTAVTPVTVYNDRGDIELVFGASNISKWANIDNTMSETAITDRITWATESAFDEFNEALRQGKYTVPLATVPQSITRNSAILAGVWLYDARGVIDMQDDQYQHRLMYLRKRVETFLQGIRSGKQVIDLDLDIQRIVPEVIDSE